MGNPSLSLKFMLVVSLSVAVSSSSSSSSLFSHRRFLSSSSSSSIKASSSLSPSPYYKASAADLLSLLGSREEASRLNSKEAQELRSCLKFLVPFSPTKSTKFDGFSITQRRDLHDNDRLERRRIKSDRSREAAENELVWWPPAPLMELARLAVDSGGDPGVIHRALDPTMITVPEVEGSKEDHCELTRTPYGRRFISEELNAYFAFLFELIVSRGPSIGLNVSLNRYDFFHGHLFLATDSGRLGILFHAKEYPAYEKEVFPCNMGYCQKGSNMTYDSSMNLRNILWLAPLPSDSTTAWLAPGVLVVLDAHPGGIIYRDIVPEYVDFVRTIYEDDFGEVAVDVNYLNVGNTVADYRIFIC